MYVGRGRLSESTGIVSGVVNSAEVELDHLRGADSEEVAVPALLGKEGRAPWIRGTSWIAKLCRGRYVEGKRGHLDPISDHDGMWGRLDLEIGIMGQPRDQRLRRSADVFQKDRARTATSALDGAEVSVELESVIFVAIWRDEVQLLCLVVGT